MAKRALVVLTHGVEDIEAVAPIDVLTRAGVEVTVASTDDGLVKAAYGTTIVPTTTLAKVADELFDAIVVPGGVKNAQGLAADERVVQMVRRHAETEKIVASICASPGTVLAEAAGILSGCRATGDPGFNNKLAATGAIVTDEDVTISGNIITARGPGAALQFALAIARRLTGDRVPDELAERWRLA